MKVLAREGNFLEGLGTMTFMGLPRYNAQKQLLTFVSNMASAAPVGAGIFAAGNEPFRVLFPQIADGTDMNGSWRTTFLLANRAAVPVSATVNLYDDAGAPMTLSVGGKHVSQIQVDIPALGIARLQTDGVDTLKAGWAAVQAEEKLSGIAIFSFYDASHNLLSEVGANAIVPLRSMSVFVESGPGISTGVAIANPGLFTNPADVTLILRDSSSNEVARTSLSIPHLGHVAKYVSELFPSAAVGNFHGKIEIVSSAPVAVLSLRQKQSIFTSLPIIP
jgi:hypothetical protein